MSRVYLGDGLYMEDDGYQISLHASNGMHDTNVVYLDTSTLQIFFKRIEQSRGLRITVEKQEDTENE